ncbi:hypothetical protein phi16_gp065 [Corynebacterium phage phi16]|uniref:hypothetical protein n=1 Tax=Corynebacterium glutamicum TaxID=1718 RepID=UPI00094543AD|nr:hypothetical protein [Corynebacterium glutamicum]APQ42568.1 hypothetical protein phi16_gp065 [Corynebacterium phage phi16]OKX80529.1 hypothetical protein AUO95_10305 [Corynebacterium glutamicum]
MKDIVLPDPDPGMHWEFRKQDSLVGPHFALVSSYEGDELGVVVLDHYVFESGVIRAAKKVIKKHRLRIDRDRDLKVLESRYPHRTPERFREVR